MKNHKEFMNIIKDILSNKIVQNLRLYPHHYVSNRYEHSLWVSYYSYRICRFLGIDHVSAARGRPSS